MVHMKRRIGIAMCALLLMTFGLQIAFAEDHITPATALERLFTAEELQSEWFSPTMLAQVPLPVITDLIDSLTEAYGPVVGIVPIDAIQYTVVLEKATVPSQIVLGSAGDIAGLFFGPPQPIVSGLAEALDAFHGLPGEVGVVVWADGQIIAAIEPDKPLSVGSAFKIPVLAAVRAEIEAGRLAWDTVVSLQAKAKSLPTGILQSWPAGSHLTVETLASLMISISDNTATDALIYLVGREAVERLAPRNTPLLTTRETFVLEHPANAEYLERYRAGDVAARRELLPELATLPLPPASVFTGGALARDIEWSATANELCGHMAWVQDLPLMSINPGVADPDYWEHVAFKGGGMPGAINLTSWLVNAQGTNLCVSVTWNDDNPIDEMRFFGATQGLLQALRDEASAGAPDPM